MIDNPLPYYTQMLNEMKVTDHFQLDLDCDHLFQHDQQLYKQLENYPAEMLECFDLALSEAFREMCQRDPDAANLERDWEQFIIQTRPFNMRTVYNIRKLDPQNIDKLVCLKGIIIRVGTIVPEMQQAVFECCKCKTQIPSSVIDGKIANPDFCDNCKSKNTFEIIHNKCEFWDKQHIKIQEVPESVPEGETPTTLHLQVHSEFVDFVKPGDRVEVTGIYRVTSVRLNTDRRTVRNVFRTFVDVVTFVKSDKNRYNNAANDMEADNQATTDEALRGEHINSFSQEQILKFKQFSQRPDFYDILVDAFAPSIWENTDVKKGIMCQLFGGVSKDFGESGRGRFRGEINILLCGDPSTAKSQLL